MSDELDLIDMTIKQFVRPKLRLDNTVLVDRLADIKAEKEDICDELGVTKAELMSADKFANLLVKAGLHRAALPTKYSERKKDYIYAFAKTDGEFTKLRKDPLVGRYVEARLIHKSTLEESRIERFLSLNGNQLPGLYTDLCVPLLYYGAHTGRDSGLDKLNLQNLSRGSALREAIVAPPGHKIVAADLAQIEARLTACFCGQWDLVEQFANDEDVYSNFASDLYGFEVNKDDHPDQRFVGKTGILQLGFQSGWMKFFNTMNDTFGVKINGDEAQRAVKTYRKRYKKISSMWYDLNEYIKVMARGEGSASLNCVEFEKDKVILPNGMPLYYNRLERVGRDYQYLSLTSRPVGYVKLYGGKLLENIVQALARIIMTTAAVRMHRRGLSPVLRVHDELIYCVKEENAYLIAGVIRDVMEQKVAWMPELPVKCEVGIGDNYGECK